MYFIIPFVWVSGTYLWKKMNTQRIKNQDYQWTKPSSVESTIDVALKVNVKSRLSMNITQYRIQYITIWYSFKHKWNVNKPTDLEWCDVCQSFNYSVRQ